MTNADDTDEAKPRRTPNIADRYADLLATLSQQQRRAIIVQLTTGFYEGWHPSRSEIADLVAVELGLLTVEDSLQRQRLRNKGNLPPDYTQLVLTRAQAKG
jgi:hypothetical protein